MKFNQMVIACFGSKPEVNVSEKFDQFKTSYLPNGSVTPKVHAVVHHLKDVVSHKNIPLGLFSEQAVDIKTFIITGS